MHGIIFQLTAVSCPQLQKEWSDVEQYRNMARHDL